MMTMTRSIRRPIRWLLALIAGVATAVGLLVATGTGTAYAASISTTQLQWDLAGLAYLPFSGIDGVYGSQTTAAVEAFQSNQCLSVDGIAGTQTDSTLSDVVGLVQDVVGVTRDGMYGPATESAVKSWQAAHNLSADGQAGPATMAAMFITRDHQCGGPSSGSPSPGTSSAAQLQWDLAGLGYLSWSGIDGIIGPVTEGATEAFQSDRCLAVDGIAGPITNGALQSVIKSVQSVAGTTADGYYGPNTRTAVKSWQAAHGLAADGQAGPITMKAMGITRALHCTAPPSGTPSPSTSATVQLQWDLAGLGYLSWSGIDGISGPLTAGATEAFQSDRCIGVDGIAGPITNSALMSVIEQVQKVAGTTADGYYGPNTRAAVASWQAAHGLTADGQAGPITMKAMGITRVVSCSSPPPGGVPPSGDMGAAIASVATAQLNNSARNHEIGGYNCNYYSTALGVGSTGLCSNGWRTESWCADFAKWVWRQAGANVGGLNPAAASFYQYGRSHGTWHGGTPRVGDAVVFGLTPDGAWAEHVGLVVAVGSGSFTMISGNTTNPATGLQTIVGQVTLADSGGGISGFTDPVTVAPADNNKTTFNYFTGKGLSKIQSAAIVGNFDQESGPSMDPTAVQQGGPGRGIAQWSVGGRWDTYSQDNMVWYAGQHSASAWALSPQLGFTWYELGTFSTYGLASLRSTTDVYDAVVAFQNKFEGCGVCMTDNRVRYADQALAYYG
jgi:peptidoglycan hydrolase-like protein with peptidoglycan-binding domain